MTTPTRYDTNLCNNQMSFTDCELAILRHAVDETEQLQKRKKVSNPEVNKIIKIVEAFLSKKKLICYGGTAINNILPKNAQFYNKELEIPDYDFYSPDALTHAKELADIYYRHGYKDVEAKSGVHQGTYKVFVNFIPVADITFLDGELFEAIEKESITISGIKYAPPNFLRMSMYLELSRPAGDVSRWEKVLKRLTLLNEHYPLNVKIDCNTVDFQRELSDNTSKSEDIYTTVRDTFIQEGVIFFGGYASSLYAKYMPKKQRKQLLRVPDFDVLSEESEKCALAVIENLEKMGITNVKQVINEKIGEIIPKHIEIKIGEDTIAFIYEPIACHNYNEITIHNKHVKVATIDTMMSFYLAFIYVKKFNYYKERIICMANFLFKVQEKNRLKQSGLLKRFSISCYGRQETLDDMRIEKAEKFNTLKRGTEEYEKWFFKYVPHLTRTKKTTSSKKSNKTLKRTNGVKTYEKITNNLYNIIKPL